MKKSRTKELHDLSGNKNHLYSIYHDLKRAQVYLPNEILQEIKCNASKNFISTSTYLRRIIIEHLRKTKEIK